MTRRPTPPNQDATARALTRCKPVKGPHGVCLVYQGNLGDTGHARGSVDGQTVRLNRVVLATRLGRELQPDELARHKCDCAACLNPWHLIEGTYQDNVDDMFARGRFVRRDRVLTPAQVKWARAQRRTSKGRPAKSVALIADTLGVRKRQVERIISGRAHA